MMLRCCSMFSVLGIIPRIIVTIAVLRNAVSGLECTGADTVGSLSHDSNFVFQDRTFILAGYNVSCSGTVVAWEFCYRTILGRGSVTFYPGIWRMNGTRGDGSNTNFAIVQSNNVTYNSSIRTSTSDFDSCQRVNLSTTDQFTAPAGSVVGLYSNVRTILLHTNDNSSITSYQFMGNQSSVRTSGNSNDVSYNIAIRVHLVTPTTSVSTSEATGVAPTISMAPTSDATAATPTTSIESTSDATIATPTTSIESTSDVTTATPTISIESTSDATAATPTTSIESTSDVTTATPTTSIESTSDAITTVVSTSSIVTISMSNTVTVSAGAQSSSDDEGSSVGIIAGCVIGVVLCITLLLVVILLWCYLRRRKGKLDITQVTRNVELSTANSVKCDMSQEPMNSTDSSNYYSAIRDQQPCAKQTNYSNAAYKNVVPDYEFPSGSYGHKNDKESYNSDTLGKNYSKIACNDYEAIQDLNEYASAVHVYSNTVRGSINYDDTAMPEYSEIGNVDGTVANDEEDIYYDPGHSEADIYACFEEKKLRMIKRDDVSISEMLGSGEFGTVHLGLWSNGSADPVQVAVKTLNSQCSESDRVKFLREAAIMGQFESDNIVRLYGVVTEVRDAIIVLEYMPKGDLREFLLDLKNKTPPEALNELKHDMLSYCRHVSAGLDHLSRRKFVHRDLAARNILVSNDDVCKIADFGMARDVADDIYYVTSGGKIPVRWTAPEAIFYKKYSVQSDVWSFGCVMYEIWSLGHKPFEDDDGRGYIKKITTGYRLPPPPGCPRAVYELMIQCWHPVANERVDSSSIVQTLQKSDRALLPGTISAKDSEELSTTLGDPLATGSNLYQGLQNTYLSTNNS